MGHNNSDQLRILKTVVDSIADGVIVIDREERVLLDNGVAARMGLPALTPGRPLMEAILQAELRDAGGHPLDPTALPVTRALQGETIVDYELVARRLDGSDVYLSTSSGPLRDEAGRITGAIAIFRDVTGRKRYEERLASLLSQLAAQQHLTMTIVDSMPEVIICTDAEFKVLLINRAALQGLDKRREEVIGRDFFSLYPGAEEQVGELIRRVLVTNEPQTFDELSYITPDGRRLFLNVSHVPVLEDGRPVGVIITAVDVTPGVEGRLRAEALAKNWKTLIDAAHSVLQEPSLNRLAQTVVEQAAEVTKADKTILWLVDPSRRKLHLIAHRGVSQATVERTAEYSYDSPSISVRAAFTGRLQEVEDALALGPEFAATARFARSEGFRGLVAVPLWARGRMVGVIGIARVEPYRLSDIERETVSSLAGIFASAILNAQLYEESGEVARESERRASQLEATLTSIADPVFVVDAEGRIKMMNEAAKRLIGGIEEPERVERLADLLLALKVRYLDGEPVSKEDMAVSTALRGEVVPDADQIATDPLTGADIYLLVSAAPIRDERGVVVGAVEVIRDISRIREMERLRDEFLSTAAHELKTPVTVLKGYSQALMKAPEALSPKSVRVLEAIDRQSTKMSRLVNDLLDISRLMAGRLQMRLERLDLADLVSEVADRMALTTTRHQLKVAVEAYPIVQGDRDRLEQVLINLIDNAIKYSPQAGPSQGRIDMRVYEEDGRAVVSVRDYGIGIPLRTQEHIFERFYRAHAGTPYDFGGMGVGLYITKEIVGRHGGEIGFQSEEGKGSTFYFSLPVV